MMTEGTMMIAGYTGRRDHKIPLTLRYIQCASSYAVASHSPASDPP